MRHLSLLLGLVLLISTPVDAAPERSEILIARGLLDFHRGQYERALASFDGAVHASPADPYARYYRGVTYGRLARPELLIVDMQVALALRPDFPEAALELGVALVQRGTYEQAVPALQLAARDPALAAKATFFLGLAELHAGDAAAARRDFDRAAASGQVEPASRYYLGLAEFRGRQWSLAHEHFHQVATGSPGSAMGREADRFLDRLRPYHVYGSVGLEYDSNVALAPSNGVIKSAVGISDQSDGRAVIVLGGTYVPWRDEQGSLTLGYEFSQTLQFELDEFNLQEHRPSAELSWDFGPVRVGILAHYAYDFLQDDSFLQEAGGLPWLVIPEDEVGRTDVFFRMRYRDFLKRPFRDVRDALNYSPGFRQSFYLDRPEDYVFVGYRFDREDAIHPDGDAFAYDGNEVEVGVGWALPWDLDIEAIYAYRNESYDQASGGRDDHEHLVQAIVGRQLTPHLRVSCAYFGDFNDSNKAVFRYDRSVASVAVDVRF